MSKCLRDLLMHTGWVVKDAFDSNLMLTCTKQVACRLPANKSLMTADFGHAAQEDESPWAKDELGDLF